MGNSTVVGISFAVAILGLIGLILYNANRINSIEKQLETV